MLNAKILSTTSFNIINYLLRDSFTPSLSAGSVHNTYAKPGPGRRIVVDTESKISISSDKLVFSSGKASPANGDPGLWYEAMARQAGLILRTGLRFTTLSGRIVSWGFDTDQAGNLGAPGYLVNSTSSLNIQYGLTFYQGMLPPLVNLTDYEFAVILRSNGSQHYQKIGGNWLLEYVTSNNTTATVYPAISNYNASVSFDYFEIPIGKWLASPIVSDSFAISFGTSNGLGHSESSGLGSGGASINWIQTSGTWSISAGKAIVTALSGGIAIATLSTSKSDVYISCKLYRSNGECGLIARYVDDNNYIKVVHDGTNLKIIKKVAGTESTVATSAKTYSSGSEIITVLSGNKVRAYYNNSNIGNGAEYTVSDSSLQSSTTHGIITTDQTNSFDDFVVYSRGTSGEHSQISSPSVSS